ncbi:hypothetical protein LguiB_024396 [Lonicera macranthoides]
MFWSHISPIVGRQSIFVGPDTFNMGCNYKSLLMMCRMPWVTHFTHCSGQTNVVGLDPFYIGGKCIIT